MNSRFLMSLAFATLLASPAMLFAHEGKHPAATDGTIARQAQPAVGVVEQFSRALQAGDLARVGTFLAEDVLILESGGAEHSKEEYLQGHAIDDAGFLKTAHVQVLRRSARAEGNLAWVGTESEIHTTGKDGKPLTLLSTETMVLKQAPQGWRIVHIHWSSRPKR